jgi:mannose-1-phosphate guanylyltransferase/phosphomannomutase
MTKKDLDSVHARMDMELGAEGAFVDDLYCCSHHPERGWRGEVLDLMVDCDCRKPKAEMLRAASAAHNIDLSTSYMIGDRFADMLAGREAGCKTIMVPTNGEEEGLSGPLPNVDYIASNLADAIDIVLSNNDRRGVSL